MHTESKILAISSNLLLDNPALAVLLLDKSGKITDVSAKCLSLLEATEYTITGNQVNDLFTGEFQFKKDCESTKEGFIEFLTKKNEVKKFRFSFSHQHNISQKNYTGCLIIFPHETYDPETSFQKIFDSNVLGLAILDDQQKIKDINETVTHLTGFTREELIGKTTIEAGLLDPKHLEKREKVWEELREKGYLRNLQREIHTKTGQLVTVLLSIEKLAVQENTFWLVSLCDITEKRKVEHQLEKAYQRLSLHLNNSPLGIVEYDANLTITQWSEQCEHIFGWRKEEVLDNNLAAFDLIYEKDREKTTKVATELLSGKVNGNISNNRNYTKKGEVIDCIWYNSVVKNKSGKVVSVMSLVQDVTKSKALEKSILFERSLSENIINSLPGVFYLCTKEGRFIKWNENFESVTGYSGEEISTMYPLDFFHGEEKKLLEAKIANVFIAGEDSVEAEFVTKTGEKIPYYFTGKAINYRGETCLMGVGIDISERVTARKLLEKTNKQLNTAQQIAKVGYWEWDWEHGQTYWSEEMYRIFDSDHIIQEPEFVKRLHPEDLETVREVRRKITRDFKPAEVDFRFTYPNGMIRNLFAKISPVFDKDGNFARMEGTLQDVTQQKLAEKELQEISSRLLLATTSARLGIFDWDLQTRKMVWNEYMYDIFRLSPSKFKKTYENWLRCLHPRDLDSFDNKINQAIEARSGFHHRFRIITDTNNIYHVEAQAIITCDENDNPLTMVGVCRDITDSINAEQQIAKTIIATQEQERFEIGRELHDHVIQLLIAGLMNLNHAKEQINEKLDALERVHQYTNTAISDIRKLSHQLAPSNLEETPIDEAFNQLLNSINSEGQFEVFFNHAISAKIKLPSEIKLNLFRVLQEQLNNIIKHSKATRIFLELLVNDFKISLSIADNGVGFDQRSMKKGIGLNNIRRRAEIFNGNVQIQAAPGKGCELLLEIPLDQKL